MFKKIVVSFIIAAMLIASVPSEARGGFGGGGGRSSGGFSSSSSRSSSSFSSPAPRASAPVSAPAVSRPTGGISSSGNVGMQRPAVTNAVRTPTPTYNPSVSNSSAYRPSYASSYGSGNHQSYSSHTTVVHHYSPSTGGGGFGMGSLAMAAMGGYMLNGIMHEHSGAVYNGSGYTNGVPTQGGQYYTQPQIGDVQQTVQQPQMQQQMQPQVVYQQVPVESGMPTWVKFLLWMFGIAIIIAIVRRIFI